MKKWLVVTILACAQFIMVLDSTVMNVSVSQVVKDLGTSVSGLQAAITFYTLTMAAFMMTGGKLGDIWGRLRVFRIGAVIYAIGSLTTALSPSLAWLFVGWSVVEGLGAVLVIPAIASLIAANYTGKDRVIGYTLIGAASGIAVAAGPLIGGYLTTYLSWRYVFAGETLIMALVLLASRRITAEQPSKSGSRIDLPSVALSASGMTLLVFGILQSKSWGWVIPRAVPQIGGVSLAPLGISIVAYLILLGAIILWQFIGRQRALEKSNRNPLLRVSMFSIKALRSGLAVLGAQYLITASVFFILPIYLQMVLGLDALQTGLKIFPLSISIVACSALGSRLISRFTPRRIVRIGQLALVGGPLIVLAAINPDLKGPLFALGMLVLGAGLGLLASQIGNVTMSSVPPGRSSEVGGLQGTFQNIGSSLGTALIGSVMITSLTSNFTNTLQASGLPASTTQAIESKAQTGLPIVTASEVKLAATRQGLSESSAQTLSDDYQDSQIRSLRASMFFIAVLALLSIPASRGVPDNPPPSKPH